MSDVKPWEPVLFGWAEFDSFYWHLRFNDRPIMEDVTLDPSGMKVTLANGQRIIVRALSDERKAARAHERAKAWIASLPDAVVQDSIR